MSGRVILVTGVSRGIGRAIVDVLMKDSDAVVYGISQSEGALVKMKSQFGSRFDYVVGDVSKEENIKQLVDRAIGKHGRLDSVIANAGVLAPVQDVNHIAVDEWKRLFDVNFFSIVSLVKLTIDYISKTNGNYIFVSSGASVKSYYAWGAYGASKAALNHFTMTIASEEEKVKAIAVAPGVVDTQMQVDIREKFGPESMTPEALKRFTDLKENDQLVPSIVPATIYANLALKGIPQELNGQYLRYNDEKLKEFL
ncbi:hypothetical protein Kpol_1057p17 [Vanderwaltozyma polyspora DSM 70294]|uniref:Uncharacterized protein n=1 Tax=Vanderwaltozyma polyspora (strain ATCC 22028 / DSM 70294 / BCRC 21397 / CBS 2163 / NBRC 10782 / NRRL Y-8283 / UCD 57-17) TaxID=436907 RepID=A7TPI5_VANPO|nr:uncharacterized protein Kpol_1057p17 [Vanderwaltozyma polyspora DSM 70294]EDO15829.1 hypothetical protein Kpol_1057p17 [Vanderwaltozyma polyspora DSM 70294]